jgi:hypothetical protein
MQKNEGIFSELKDILGNEWTLEKFARELEVSRGTLGRINADPEFPMPERIRNRLRIRMGIIERNGEALSANTLQPYSKDHYNFTRKNSDTDGKSLEVMQYMLRALFFASASNPETHDSLMKGFLEWADRFAREQNIQEDTKEKFQSFLQSVFKETEENAKLLSDSFFLP